MNKVTSGISGALLACAMVSTSAGAAEVGGHVGVVVPVATVGSSGTSSVADNFVFGIPVGIGFKLSDRVVIDLEFVPLLDPDTRDMVFLVHPGVVFGLGNGFGTGIRLAAEFPNRAWGATLIFNKGFSLTEDLTWFAEAVVPLRVSDAGGVDPVYSATFALHTGVLF